MRAASFFALVVAACCAVTTTTTPVDAFAAAPVPVKPNDKLPLVDLHWGFPPLKVNIAQYAGGKKMLIVGLPGAFTPT
jgi:hypothetical protein